MVHYAVTINGKVVGSRSSASHAQQIYTHALVVTPGRQGEYGVMSYHSSERLALDAKRTWTGRMGAGCELQGSLTVVPVAVTARRAKVGDLVVPQGVL
jgi:hypothetical protein